MEQSRALSLSSGSSLTQLAAKSRAILQCETSPQQALAAAERLIGCWPHARPPDPKTYSAAISAALAGYPLGLVQECCDPRTGLARTREFPPTVAAIVEWCDERLAWHHAVAKYVARQQQAEPQFSEEYRRTMLQRIAEIPRRYFRSVQGAIAAPTAEAAE